MSKAQYFVAATPQELRVNMKKNGVLRVPVNYNEVLKAYKSRTGGTGEAENCNRKQQTTTRRVSFDIVNLLFNFPSVLFLCEPLNISVSRFRT